MWKYSKRVIDHFTNPRNVGSLDNPDGHSEVGSEECGDAMTLDIAVDGDGKIDDIKFRTFGCAAAIASASALTEMARGMDVRAASDITAKDIAEYLGGIPDQKFHCSVMGHQALTEAVSDYLTKLEAVESAVEDLTRRPSSALEDILCGRGLEVVSIRPSMVSVRTDCPRPKELAEFISAALNRELGRQIPVVLEDD